MSKRLEKLIKVRNSKASRVKADWAGKKGELEIGDTVECTNPSLREALLSRGFMEETAGKAYLKKLADDEIAKAKAKAEQKKKLAEERVATEAKKKEG